MILLIADGNSHTVITLRMGSQETAQASIHRTLTSMLEAITVSSSNLVEVLF